MEVLLGKEAMRVMWSRLSKLRRMILILGMVRVVVALSVVSC
jgi:hypothetical protein